MDTQGKAEEPKQAPTGTWVWYQIFMPLLQLLVGGALLLLPAVTARPEPLTLLGGAALSLYAVGLLANAVYTLNSPKTPPVSEQFKTITDRVLWLSCMIAVLLVALYQTGVILHTWNLVLYQGILVVPALAYSWKVRA